MGMYDTIHINLSQLPVSADDQKRLVDESFQSKSLDCTLSDYYITEEGFLEFIDGESYGDEPERVHNRVRLADASGSISFYTSTSDDEWFEFIALFDKGCLGNIIRIPNGANAREGSLHWTLQVNPLTDDVLSVMGQEVTAINGLSQANERLTELASINQTLATTPGSDTWQLESLRKRQKQNIVALAHWLSSTTDHWQLR